MYEKQMSFFEDGGLYEEGGMTDEESGNEVPPGSTRKEVRDDIPAMLSEGEFVFPADVVRYFGLERLMKMRQEAKSGLKMMDAMGQMGNSEEATIEDDLPFDVAELMVVDIEDDEDENENEFSKGGMPVKLAPGGNINRADILAGTDTSATIAGGAYTNVPTSSGILVPQYTTGATGATSDAGNLEFKRYENAQGIVINVPFQNNQPLYPIPAGFSESSAVAPEATPTPATEPEGRDGMDGGSSTPEVKSVSEMTDAEIAKGLSTGKTMGKMASTAAGFASPVLGGLVSIGTAARYNDLLDEAKKRGLPEAEGKSRQGSIFGGEASLMENLNDVNNDGVVNFGDTWMGDLLGFDGKVGVQGPGLSGSRTGDRRAGWNEKDTASYEAAAIAGGSGRGEADYGLSPAEQAAASTSRADSPEDFAGYVDPYAENEKYMAKGGLASKKAKPSKPSVNKNRGVAARKKK